MATKSIITLTVVLLSAIICVQAYETGEVYEIRKYLEEIADCKRQDDHYKMVKIVCDEHGENPKMPMNPVDEKIFNAILVAYLEGRLESIYFAKEQLNRIIRKYHHELK